MAPRRRPVGSLALRLMSRAARPWRRHARWAPPIAGAAGPTVVATTCDAHFGSTTATLAVPVAVAAAAGDHVLLAVAATTTNTPTITSVVDTQGNAWQIDQQPGGLSTRVLGLASAHLTTALATTDTITVTLSAIPTTGANVLGIEVSGLATSAWLDAVAAIATGSSTTPTSNALTTTAAGDFLWAPVGENNVAMTPAAGWTELDETLATKQIHTEYQVAGAAGSYSAGATLASSIGWVMSLVAYKAAASSTSPLTGSAGAASGAGATAGLQATGSAAARTGAGATATLEGTGSAGALSGAGASLSLTMPVTGSAGAASGAGATPQIAGSGLAGARTGAGAAGRLNASGAAGAASGAGAHLSLGGAWPGSASARSFAGATLALVPSPPLSVAQRRAILAGILPSSHQTIVQAKVLAPPGSANAGTVLASFDVVEGSVTVDRTQAVRRQMQSVKVVDPTGTLIPKAATDLFMPYGNEVQLWRGALDPETGTSVLFSLGIFGISDAVVTDTGADWSVTLSGYDRAQHLQRLAWTKPFAIPAGTNYAAAIASVVNAKAPGYYVLSLAQTVMTTPAMVLGASLSGDPWSDIQSMAQSIGAEAYFDVDGILVLRPIPDPSVNAPVWSYAEGAQAVMTQLQRTLSNTDNGTANPSHVVVTGENTTNTVPVRADAYDTNPASPTYYLGPYGDVPMVVQSPLVTTTAQAQAMASALLMEYSGATDGVQLDIVPNPSHEAGDVVTIQRARDGVGGNYMIQSMTIPLAWSATMQLITKGPHL